MQTPPLKKNAFFIRVLSKTTSSSEEDVRLCLTRERERERKKKKREEEESLAFITRNENNADGKCPPTIASKQRLL